MTLYEKIKTLYTELTDADFAPEGTIMLQNDSDGNGDYIKNGIILHYATNLHRNN